ncbi:hypothetical protein XELAEV_18036400mg, partial [Xenopus laevis]
VNTMLGPELNFIRIGGDWIHLPRGRALSRTTPRSLQSLSCATPRHPPHVTEWNVLKNLFAFEVPRAAPWGGIKILRHLSLSKGGGSLTHKLSATPVTFPPGSFCYRDFILWPISSSAEKVPSQE